MKSPLTITLCLMASLVHLVAADASRINKSAQALAKSLSPTQPAKKINSADLARIQKQMIGAIETLERSNRTSGPPPESLLETALDFRDDIQDFEKLLVTSTLLKAWREANGRGLFDENGKFTGKISRGKGVGDKCYFELIVPAEVYPPGSNQLSNLRIVTVDRRRTEGAELTIREKSHHAQLVKMVEEKISGAALAKFEKGEKTNAIGQTEAQALALWESDMAEAGELAQQLPTIQLKARMSGTPSHMTQQRWRTTTEVINFSKHPTEVTLEVYIIGITDEKRDYYLMSKSSKVLKLRGNESVTVESYTRAEKSYKGKADDYDEIPKKERGRTKVRCRGFAVIVKHGKETPAFMGSDALLERYANPAEPDLSLSKLMVF